MNASVRFVNRASVLRSPEDAAALRAGYGQYVEAALASEYWKKRALLLPRFR